MEKMINFLDGRAEITFNNDLYSPEILEQAISDFKETCKITIEKKGLTSIITLVPDENLKEITYEFCNYVLALMKDAYVQSAKYVKNE